MKRTLLATAIGLAFSATAQAVYMPPVGPIYFKFDNREQISASNSIVQPESGAAEGNWGIFEVSSISLGDPENSDPVFYDPISPPIWFNEITDGAEITGIFYGATNLEVCPEGVAICSTGGFLDMYWDDTPDAQVTTALPSGRTGDASFDDFTDGDFLVRLAFDSGISDDDEDVTIIGSAAPTNDGFAGFADSFLSVVDVTGDGVIDSADGLWAALFDGDGFETAWGDRDMRLKNSYNGPLDQWNGGEDTDIFGASSQDPARVYTVPEPATILLLGGGLLGMGFSARRRRRA